MTTPTPLISMRHVSHQFVGSNRQAINAIHDVSLELQAGTFTCLIGPSGCGKSTVLRLLAGLIQVQSGAITLAGKPLTQPSRAISIMFQSDNLMSWRTVEQNISLPLQLAHVPLAEQKARVAHWLHITGLEGFERRYPAELSGGMAQRVALARGLITQPQLLLLDEPFGALDALTREAMWQELLRIWMQTSATVVMVTHSIREAILLADRVMVMSARPGHFVQSVKIPFPRPRGLDLLANTEFVATEAHIRAAIEPQLR